MHFEFTYFYFVLIHLQLKRQLRSCMRSRSFLENQTQFQTKMGKVYTRFQTKKAQKHTLCGSTYLLMAYITEYAPGY